MQGQEEMRVLGLEGASNFRDFGGYAAGDGRRVRWRHLYRSNKLSELTTSDRARLDALSIRTIFDLRVRPEREADPTSWSHPELAVRTFPPGDKRPLVEMAAAYAPDEAGARALMKEFYGTMPRTMAHVFGAVLREVAEGASPCIVHCSAGKDRTGIACALLLSALGVPRETVIEDYAMTQMLRRPESDMARAVNPGRHEGLRARFSPQAIAVMMAAHADYLGHAFAAMEEDHGSVRDYIRDRLEVDEATLARLADRLLEPA